MKTRVICRSLACVALFGALIFVSSIHADQWNKKTIMSVNQSVKIPGRVLLPGKYVFKLMDSLSNRTIVQVWNGNESDILSTIIAIQAYRTEATGRPVFRFYDGAPIGTPPALKQWFYAGEISGVEFTYPKREAMEIAAYSGANVPVVSTEQEEVKESTASVASTPSTPAESEAPATTTNQNVGYEYPPTAPPAVSDQPQAATSETSMEDHSTEQQSSTASSNTSGEETRETKTLPKTASTVPLVGLTGLLSFGMALVVGTIRRRHR